MSLIKSTCGANLEKKNNRYVSIIRDSRVHDYKQSITEGKHDAMFACGAGKRLCARVHQPVEGIGSSLMVCLEGPIPQLPLMT